MNTSPPDPPHAIDDQPTPLHAAPGAPPVAGAPLTAGQNSVVDTILDLDAMLSADVRRAEKTTWIATEPWREARIDELDIELTTLVDDTGRPLTTEPGEESIADHGTTRTAVAVAQEIQEEQRLYQASMRTVKVRALSSDDFKAFQTKHKKALEGEAPYPVEMWDELIAACAIAPLMPIEKVHALRGQLGGPALTMVEAACWEVCSRSGVSVPKSPLSSAVLRRAARATS